MGSEVKEKDASQSEVEEKPSQEAHVGGGDGQDLSPWRFVLLVPPHQAGKRGFQTQLLLLTTEMRPFCFPVFHIYGMRVH